MDDLCGQCGEYGPVTADEDLGIICAECMEGFGPCSEEDLPR